MLWIGFTAIPLIMGADKFTNVLTQLSGLPGALDLEHFPKE